MAKEQDKMAGTNINARLAIGLIETRGLVAAIEAADAMMKAAHVELDDRQQVGDGLVTVIVKGEVGAVRTAVEAGAMAAQKVGELISQHIIARPHEDLPRVSNVAT